jgi:hypothetical protein
LKGRAFISWISDFVWWIPVLDLTFYHSDSFV